MSALFVESRFVFWMEFIWWLDKVGKGWKDLSLEMLRVTFLELDDFCGLIILIGWVWIVLTLFFITEPCFHFQFFLQSL